MYKWIIFLALFGLIARLITLQLDQHRMLIQKMELKRMVNVVAHAAALQSDEELLAHGIIAIDEDRAAAAAAHALQMRLQRRMQAGLGGGEAGAAGDGNSRLSAWAEAPEITSFSVYHEESPAVITFDDGEVLWVHPPGVVVELRAVPAAGFGSFDPAEWHIRGTAELR